MRLWAAAAALLVITSCSRPAAPVASSGASTPDSPAKLSPSIPREVHLTGLVEALHSSRIVVPQIAGQNSRLTLTRIIPNGSRVDAGEVIAEFDPLEQMDNARTANGKFDDLGHQVEQKAAQNYADAEKRRSDYREAEADLGKAMLEVSKAEILPAIQREQNDIKAQMARLKLESLQKTMALHDKSDAAALRIPELQRDRQKVALERTNANIAVMQMKAPLAGMVAHSIQYRSGQITHVQQGDQLYRGNALLSIFDPSEMLVRCSVGEPDREALVTGARASVFLDAYPDVEFPAHFEAVSPIATTALGSPVKTFNAVFKLERVDGRMMPDMSAAVVIHTTDAAKATKTVAAKK